MGSGEVNFLRSMELFEPLSGSEVERISGGIPVKVFERGRNVYTPAYTGGILFLLFGGRVRVYRAEKGDEITLAVIRSGDFFGEATFTERARAGAYAEALETSRVGLMNRQTLERIIHDFPRVGVKAIEILSERLSVCEERMIATSIKKVPSRLASLLLDLDRSEGSPTPEGRRLATRYTHEQLGAMIGAKRVAVTRSLTELRRSGVVGLHQRRIYIMDIEALRRAAS
jgi:CRP/FNR family transcriptional regulator, cyclic AMP receptor protein